MIIPPMQMQWFVKMQFDYVLTTVFDIFVGVGVITPFLSIALSLSCDIAQSMTLC